MNFANFNQDASCLSVGTSSGYRLFNCCPFGRFYTAEDGACGCVAMLFATALIAVAGHGEHAHRSPRRLRVINTKRERVLCELTFPTTVLALKMNRKRLIVVLEDQIYIYNIANMKLLHTIDTVPNREGVADLAANANFLVYPAGPPAKHALAPTNIGASSVSTGELVVFDCEGLAPVNVIRAHRSPPAQAVFNDDGSLVATTSDKGTLIRVFSVPSGTLLYQFRRGTYHSRVYSLAFNLSSTLVAVSSATGTVHIYKLNAQEITDKLSQDNGDSVRSNISSVSSSGMGEEQPQANSPDISQEYIPQETNSDTDQVSNSTNPASQNPIESQTPKKSGWGIRRRVSKALPKTPAAVQDIWESRSRDFAWFKLPTKAGARSVLAFAAPPLTNVIYVATSTGKFLHYQMDIEKGGECELTAEYPLLG